MRGINKVILIGNATRDAELRYTGSGKAVTSIRLATNRTIHGQEETQFHSVVCWETLAETVAKFVKKGDPLYVEGRLQYRSYQDEEGKERGVAEIVAADVQFLGRRKDETTSASPDAASEHDAPSSAPSHSGKDEYVSPDEIPF
jgi:single-strand DNA-binding protein